MLDANQYILINLFNANTETEQVKILEELQSLFGISQNKTHYFQGDFNIYISKLVAKSGKPIWKRKSIANLVEEKEGLANCNIWRIRNPNSRKFTSRQNHLTGFIES